MGEISGVDQMIFFKKVEKVLEKIGKYDSRRMVKTERGWFVVYQKEKDYYTRHMDSLDKRYGLLYGSLALGREVSYYNPRVAKKSNMGRVKVIKN